MSERTVTTIDEELAAVRLELAQIQIIHGALLDERKSALPVRARAIIRDFDAGHGIKTIACDLDTTVNAVWQVLRKAGRTAKSRAVPITHLPAEQQRAYHKARRMGHGHGVARQMATLTRGTAEPAVSVGQ